MYKITPVEIIKFGTDTKSNMGQFRLQKYDKSTKEVITFDKILQQHVEDIQKRKGV